MNFIRENKALVCIILIIIFMFTFSRIVALATVDDLDNIRDIDEVDNEEENEFKEIDKEDDDNESIFTDNISKKESGTNTKIESVEKEKDTKTNANELAKAGIEDAPGILLITICAGCAIYGYIKIKQYK